MYNELDYELNNYLHTHPPNGQYNELHNELHNDLYNGLKIELDDDLLMS